MRVMNLKKTGVTIWVGCQGYYEVEVNKKLPTARAWCKRCAKESAKPKAFVSFNGRLGIVVECEKCGDIYILYEDRYIEWYEGRHTEYGFIPPTHGKNVPIPRAVADKMDAARAERKKKLDEDLCRAFNVSQEQLAEMRKKREAENAKWDKRFEREANERAIARADQQIEDASAERKRLIAEGILVYKKGYGLVNTQTGEVVKL